ncbi:MAG TPA: hypothetical protein VE999_09365 [Gemmataceae bacterium]|nr:hypothetical protein [Gemmataceae bacterium]
MFGKLGRRLGLGLLALLLVFAAVQWAAAINPNERTVKPGANVQDADDIHSPDSKIWVLDFKFKDPRLIKVNVPGRGQKVCWYLWYQVINNTSQPHTFIPDFELVTSDRNTVHHDQILPRVQDAIRQLEDPTDYLKIKNSVTIAAEPIPPSKKNAEPRAVTGVAIWDDVDPDANYYSIFISGLSNGWAVTDDAEKPGEKSIIRRKTLQLNFRRLGDRYYQKSEEIRFVQPPQWIYRGTSLSAPALPSQKEGKKQ